MTTACKLHCYTPDNDGYARITINYKKVYLHRYTYCTHNRISLESIKGKVIRHTCDNPRCVNPEHLILGTNKENVQDRVDRNRSHKPEGDLHPGKKLTAEDIPKIKAMYAVPGTRYKHIAEHFGISEKAVGNIINNVSWKVLQRGDSTI